MRFLLLLLLISTSVYGMAKINDTEIGGYEYGAVRWRFEGEGSDNKFLQGISRRYLGEMKRWMQLGGLESYEDVKGIHLEDGTTIHAKAQFGQDGMPDMQEVVINTTGTEDKECLGYLLKTLGADKLKVTLPSGNVLSQKDFDDHYLYLGAEETDVALSDDGARYYGNNAAGSTWETVLKEVQRSYGSDVSGDYDSTYFTGVDGSESMLRWTPYAFLYPYKRADNSGVIGVDTGIRIEGGQFILSSPALDGNANGTSFILHTDLNPGNRHFNYADEILAYYPHTEMSTHSSGFDAFDYTLDRAPFGIPITVEKGEHIVSWDADPASDHALEVTLFLKEGGKLKNATTIITMPDVNVQNGKYYDVLVIKVGSYKSTGELIKDIYAP